MRGRKQAGAVLSFLPSGGLAVSAPPTGRRRQKCENVRVQAGYVDGGGAGMLSREITKKASAKMAAASATTSVAAAARRRLLHAPPHAERRKLLLSHHNTVGVQTARRRHRCG